MERTKSETNLLYKGSYLQKRRLLLFLLVLLRAIISQRSIIMTFTNIVNCSVACPLPNLSPSDEFAGQSYQRSDKGSKWFLSFRGWALLTRTSRLKHQKLPYGALYNLEAENLRWLLGEPYHLAEDGLVLSQPLFPFAFLKAFPWRYEVEIPLSVLWLRT